MRKIEGRKLILVLTLDEAATVLNALDYCRGEKEKATDDNLDGKLEEVDGAHAKYIADSITHEVDGQYIHYMDEGLEPTKPCCELG